MPAQWKEVVRLCFKGERFRDHALDLTALSELSQFQKLVEETAKVLWRTANPDRDRLPKHFEDRTRLCLRRIDEGSAATPLEVLEEIEPTELFEEEHEPTEIEKAINLAHRVFEAIEHDQELPGDFPKTLVAEYVKWGQSLAEDEEIELTPPGKTGTRISAESRKRLASFWEAPYQDMATVTGEVLEADVRRRCFQLWVDDRTSVAVAFTEEQEELVTTALKDHRSVQLRVIGRGRYLPIGQLQRFEEVTLLEIVAKTPAQYDASAPPVEEVLASLAAKVPPEDWQPLPDDLTEDLDHYIYGTPKK